MAYNEAYKSAMAAAVAGMMANQEPKNLISREIEDADGVGFGIPVFQGTDDHQIVKDGTVVRGVTVIDKNRPAEQGDAYVEGDTVAVMVKGVVWVTAGANVAAGEPVYLDGTTKAFTNVATDNVAVSRAIFDSSASSGELVKVRLS